MMKKLFESVKMPKLANHSVCTGCTACMSVCPKHCIIMKPDEYGFKYPAIVNNTACVLCGLCNKVCPVTNYKNGNKTLQQSYAAYSMDYSIRSSSSSGGIFSEIATKIINDGGAVYGAAYDSNFDVRHQCAKSIKQIEYLKGAKYSESDLGNTFTEIKEHLDSNQQVLFSGTSCQVAGLKSFLRKDYTNLICIDFVCHSIPSPLVWSKYVEYRAKVDNSGIYPIRINLRSKESGWSNYNYSNEFNYKNGIKHSEISKDSLFMKLFISGCISRDSCSNCLFKGYNRSSDITLGDFWGIWDIKPEMDDNKGTSMVLIHTNKGSQIWSSIRDRIRCVEVSLKETSQSNPSVLESYHPNKKREKVLATIKNDNIEECSLLLNTSNNLFGRIRRFIKSFVLQKSS